MANKQQLLDALEQFYTVLNDAYYCTAEAKQDKRLFYIWDTYINIFAEHILNLSGNYPNSGDPLRAERKAFIIDWLKSTSQRQERRFDLIAKHAQEFVVLLEQQMQQKQGVQHNPNP